jgi:hypothetical protein
MGLKSKDSNIAYGVVSIPTIALSKAERFYDRLDKQVRDYVLSDFGKPFQEKEVKATTLNTLTPEHIDDVAKMFKSFFKQNNIRILSLYVNAEGFIKYAIRNHECDATPEDFKIIQQNEGAEYDKWLASTLAQWKAGVGNTALIKQIITQLVSCIASYHVKALKQSFELVCDSTNPAEDAIIRTAADEMVEHIRRAEGMDEVTIARYYRGMRAEESINEVGLRLADFVAGATRMLYRKHPALLSDNARFEVLTAKANTDMIVHEDYGILPAYNAVMDKALAKVVKEEGQGLCFPYWIQYYAQQSITLYTKEGGTRHWWIEPEFYTEFAD